jgi:CheY-like chemotaxis protein
MPADQVEHSKSADVANDRLRVDDAGFDGQLLDRGGGEGEAVTEVIAVASEQTNAPAAAVRHDAEAVVLDLVNPARSGRRMLDRPRQAGLKTRQGPIGLQSAAELTRNRHRVECRGDATRVEFPHPVER